MYCRKWLFRYVAWFLFQIRIMWNLWIVNEVFSSPLLRPAWPYYITVKDAQHQQRRRWEEKVRACVCVSVCVCERERVCVYLCVLPCFGLGLSAMLFCNGVYFMGSRCSQEKSIFLFLDCTFYKVGLPQILAANMT